MKSPSHLTTIALLAAGIVLWTLGCRMPPTTSRQAAPRADNAETSANAVNVERGGWRYDEFPEKMGRGNIKIATTTSTNSGSFDSPYNGEQHADLTLRVHPEHGRDVMFSIARVQFLAGVGGCTVVFRFDDDAPIELRGNEPTDHTTNVIFIDEYEKVVTSLKRAKRLRIEAPFYKEGNQVFDFNVEGLEWDVAAPEKTK